MEAGFRRVEADQAHRLALESDCVAVNDLDLAGRDRIGKGHGGEGEDG